MRETQVIERIRKLARAGPRNKEIVFGIGDDCAILRPSATEDLVFTSDFVLEGRHFTLDTHGPADIGHKALARGLSDLAAMGSKPVFCLVSLALPASLGQSWLDRFYKGLLALATRYKITLIGGDLAYDDGNKPLVFLKYLQNYRQHMVDPKGRLIPMISCIGNHEVTGGYKGTREKSRRISTRAGDP